MAVGGNSRLPRWQRRLQVASATMRDNVPCPVLPCTELDVTTDIGNDHWEMADRYLCATDQAMLHQSQAHEVYHTFARYVKKHLKMPRTEIWECDWMQARPAPVQEHTRYAMTGNV